MRREHMMSLHIGCLDCHTWEMCRQTFSLVSACICKCTPTFTLRSKHTYMCAHINVYFRKYMSVTEICVKKHTHTHTHVHTSMHIKLHVSTCKRVDPDTCTLKNLRTLITTTNIFCPHLCLPLLECCAPRSHFL